MTADGEVTKTPEGKDFDLSAFDFGPSWAREDQKKKEEKRKNFSPRNDGHRQERNKHERKENRRGRFRKEGHRPLEPQVEAPKGYNGGIMPVDEGLDNLAKEILGSGRTYSVFDIAKLVMGGRDRFRFMVKAPDGKVLYRCKEDNSLWLSRQEALGHLWKSDWRTRFYEEVETEGEAPAGNYQAVAKCGISGEILGPPNYHGYQMRVIELHRERFANMPLDDYKRKIVTERGEEVVEAWKQAMKVRISYRPKSPDVIEAETQSEKQNEVAVEEVVSELPENEAPEEQEAPDAISEDIEPETTPQDAESQQEPNEGSETQEPTEPPASIGAEALLEGRKELEQHFLKNFYDQAFEECSQAWVEGNIAGAMLSPPLLTLLRETVAEERRYPAKLVPTLCRQLSGRHLAVFKWDKKLKVGPSRPHIIPEGITLAERPKQIIDWLDANSGKSLEELWKSVFPEDASRETKHAWYHDLHWILNQGYALLLSNSSLHLSKVQKEEGRGRPAKPAAVKKTPNKEEQPIASPKEEADTPELHSENTDAPTREMQASKEQAQQTPPTELDTEEQEHRQGG